jgi:hypothetical protein
VPAVKRQQQQDSVQKHMREDDEEEECERTVSVQINFRWMKEEIIVRQQRTQYLRNKKRVNKPKRKQQRGNTMRSLR